MFNRSVCGQGWPVRLGFDGDPLLQFRRWQAILRILGIEPIPTVARCAGHPFVNASSGRFGANIWIGCSWNRMDLERRLELFKTYYNESRVHQSLEGATPEEKRRRSNRGAGQPARLCLAKPLPWLIRSPVAA